MSVNIATANQRVPSGREPPRTFETVEPPGALAYYPGLRPGGGGGAPSAASGRRGEGGPPSTAPGSRAPTPRAAPLAGSGLFYTSSPLGAEDCFTNDVSAEGFLRFQAEVPYLRDCATTAPFFIYQPPSILQLRNAVTVDVQGLSDFSSQRLPSISLALEAGEFAFNFQSINNELSEAARANKLCPPDALDWDTIAYEAQRRSPDPEESLWEERFWREMRRAREREREEREHQAQQRRQQRERKALARASVSSVGGSSLPALSTPVMAGVGAVSGKSAADTPLSRQQSMSSIFGGAMNGTPPTEFDLSNSGTHLLQNHRRTSSSSTLGTTNTTATSAAMLVTSPCTRRIYNNNSHSNATTPTAAQRTAKGFLRRARYNEGRHLTPSSGATPSLSTTIRGVAPIVARSPTGAVGPSGAACGGRLAENGFRFPVPSARSESSTWHGLNSTRGSGGGGSNLLSVMADTMSPFTPHNVEIQTPRGPVKRSSGATYSDIGTGNFTTSKPAGVTAATPPERVVPASCTAPTAPVAAAASAGTAASKADATDPASPTGAPFVLARCSSPIPPSALAATGGAPSTRQSHGSVGSPSTVVTASGRDTTMFLPAPASPHPDPSLNHSVCSQPSAARSNSVTVVLATEPTPAEAGRQRRPGSQAASRTESLKAAHSSSTPQGGVGTTERVSGGGAPHTLPPRTEGGRTTAGQRPPLTLKQPPPSRPSQAAGAPNAYARLAAAPPRSSPSDSVPPPPAEPCAASSGDGVRPLPAHPQPPAQPSASSAAAAKPAPPTTSAQPASRVCVTPVKGTPNARPVVAHPPVPSTSGTAAPTSLCMPEGGGGNKDVPSAATSPSPAVVVVRQHEAISPARTPRRAKGEGTPPLEREAACGAGTTRHAQDNGSAAAALKRAPKSVVATGRQPAAEQRPRHAPKASMPAKEAAASPSPTPHRAGIDSHPEVAAAAEPAGRAGAPARGAPPSESHPSTVPQTSPTAADAPPAAVPPLTPSAVAPSPTTPPASSSRTPPQAGPARATSPALPTAARDASTTAPASEAADRPVDTPAAGAGRQPQSPPQAGPTPPPPRTKEENHEPTAASADARETERPMPRQERGRTKKAANTKCCVVM